MVGGIWWVLGAGEELLRVDGSDADDDVGWLGWVGGVGWRRILFNSVIAVVRALFGWFCWFRRVSSI